MLDATMSDWEDDVAQAVDEARDTAGSDRVSLVGLRLGGALAAQVAASRPDDVKELVLWDPVVSGAAYVDELRRAAANGASVRPGEGTTVNVNGFPLTPAVATELAGVNLANVADRLPSRTLVVSSDASRAEEPAFREFRNALTHRESSSVEIIDAPPAWVEYRGSGTALMPVSILQRITQWLS
jgi:pimeloyl-ACP methyl ester carboxylesterase